MSIRYLSGLTVDSTVLVVDAANDRVGIGTASPSVLLDVYNSSGWGGIDIDGTSGGEIRLQKNGTTYGNLYASDNSSTAFVINAAQANDLILQTNSSERLRITSAGNVGIGTTSPSYKLQVNGEGNGLYVIGANSAPYTQTIAKFVYGGNNNSINIENQGGKASFQARDSSDAAMNLHLNPIGGNVGIGTTSPAHLLDVSGTARILNGIYFNNATGSFLWETGANALRFGTNNTERMRITSDGNVGIGTTAPAAKLHVYTPSSGTAIVVGRASGNSSIKASADADGGYLSLDSTGSATIINHYVSDNVWLVTGGGNVGIGTTGPASKLQIGSVGSTGYGVGNGLAFGDGTRAGALNVDASGTTLYSSTNLIFSPGTAEAVRITSAGNVGIGTTSPAYKLDVSGDIRSTTINLNTQGVNVSSYGFLSQTLSGQMTFLGHNVRASSTVNNTAVVVNGGWISSLIKQYYNEGITFHTSTTEYAADATYPLADTERLRITSGGNVGIGTTEPQRKLDSYTIGGAFAGNNYMRLGVGAAGAYGGNNHLEFSYNDYGNVGGRAFDNILAKIEGNTNVVSATDVGGILVFSTKATGGTYLTAPVERMRITSAGNVGIGTTAPVGILHLYKAAAATRLAIDGDAGQNRLISYRTGALQRFGLYVNNTAESGSNAGSNFAIRAYSDAGTLLSTPFFINRATGNVGIGTTTPAAKLDVSGDIILGGTAAYNSVSVYNNSASGGGGYVAYQNGVVQAFFGAAGWYTGTTDTGVVIGTDSSSRPIRFYTNTERMRITGDGNVGIGTTSPGSKLDIGGNAVGSVQAIFGRGNDDSNFTVRYTNGSAGTNNTVQGTIGLDYANGVWADMAAIKFIRDSTAGILAFYTSTSATSGTERMRIASTGATRLNAYGSGSFTGTVAYNLAVDSSGNIIETAGGVVDGSGTANYVSKWSDANTLTDSVIYDNGTNVGIGTTPNQGVRLQVAGAVDAWNSLNTLLRLSHDGTRGKIQSYTGGGYSPTALNADGGNVLIGTDTDAGYKLDVSGTGRFTDTLTASSTAGGTSAIFQNTGAQNSNGIELRGGTAGTSVNWKIEKDNTVGNAFQITPSTANGGTTYTTPSLTIASTGAATFSSSVTAQSLITSYSLDGDPQLGLFTNASTGTSAEATIYVRNGTTSNDATFIQALGTGFTTTGGFVQDGGTIGTGTALSGGMSLMVRANADMRFYTNGHTNERMRITSAGNVGIGTTSPATKLHIVGYSRTDGGLLLNGSDADYREMIFTTSSAARWNLYAYGGEGGSNAGSVLYLARYADNGDYIANVATFLRTNGYVGIATITPTQQLHVSGNIRVTGAYYDSSNSAGSSGQVLSSTGSGTAWVNQGEATATSLFDLLPAARTTYAWSVQLTAGTWADIFSSNTVLSNGTWMVQAYVDDYAVGGLQYQETYSGVMSWGSANNTNQSGNQAISEIVLHRSGHAANSGNFYLRTVERAVSTLLFQGMSNQTYSAASTINFKFVKIF